MTMYVTKDTARLYDAPTGGGFDLVLIWGDEVEETGDEEHNRTEVVYRQRTGWVPSPQLGPDPVTEFYFVDVGQGDCTLIETPHRNRVLVDGGLGTHALQFLVWKYRLDLPEAESPNLRLHRVVISHADSDHLAGITAIIGHPRIIVDEIWHSGVALYERGAGGKQTKIGDFTEFAGQDYLDDWHTDLDDLALEPLDPAYQRLVDRITLARAKGDTAAYTRVVAGESFDLDGVIFDVLGPRPEKIGTVSRLRRFDTGNTAHAKTINGHSVVLRVSIGDVRTLLPGDVNEEAGEFFLEDPAMRLQLQAHIVKAPHHGSHEFHGPFLDAVNPQVTVVSSGEQPDHGHPRANFLGHIGRASRSGEPLIYSTELAANYISAAGEMTQDDFDDLDPAELGTMEIARALFLKRLAGIINVRTNGAQIFSARRVTAGYAWTKYLQDAAPPDPIV